MDEKITVEIFFTCSLAHWTGEDQCTFVDSFCRNEKWETWHKTCPFLFILFTDAPKGSLTDYISKLSLNIKNEWPLDVFFTTESREKYNELFRFLLKVRLLQMELNTIWVNTRKIFRFPVPKGPAELKNVMSFFIDHLQHYLQVK